MWVPPEMERVLGTTTLILRLTARLNEGCVFFNSKKSLKGNMASVWSN